MKTSGRIVAFEFDGVRFPNEPKTAFYDWLYVSAILEHRDWLRSRLTKFLGFSDIEFNPDRSLNCQARSCALFASLLTTGLLEAAAESPRAFFDTIVHGGTSRTSRRVYQGPGQPPPFIETFRRLYELKAAVPDPTHPDAYFQHFEERLQQSAHVRDLYMKFERPLETLDEVAWRDLLKRAAPLTVLRDAKRGWQSLFDTLNESKGYAYLQSLGCSDIAFIKRDSKKTPDLCAALNGRRVICEVKTINVSQDEADLRERIHRGEMLVRDVATTITIGLLKKVTDTLTHAIEQLDREDPDRTARRIVFTVLHFDDWIGDYQTEYIAQLDAHLSANPVQGVELAFSPASNSFERHFVMRSAAVVEI